MSEELNQVTEENVFDDVTAEEENLFEDEENTNESSEGEVKEEEVPKSFLKVKYNGEDQDLNEDDARMYAQKGMNYDKIYEPLEKLAKANNMQVGEYLNQLNATQHEFEVSKEVEKLREDPKYADLSDEILEEIANSHITEFANNQLKIQQENENSALEREFARQVDVFKREHPDLEPDDVDEEVFNLVRQGYTLLEAYNKWEANSAKLKAEKQNQENKKRSLGNTTNAGKVESDDFLKGFLNG